MTDELKDLLDQALAKPEGITLPFPTRQEAVNFRMSIYAARRRMAQRNLALYPEGDPLHGASPYDCLQITLNPSVPPDTDFTLTTAPRKPAPKPLLAAPTNDKKQ